MLERQLDHVLWNTIYKEYPIARGRNLHLTLLGDYNGWPTEAPQTMEDRVWSRPNTLRNGQTYSLIDI